jgi:molecular chaperone GrpE
MSDKKKEFNNKKNDDEILDSLDFTPKNNFDKNSFSGNNPIKNSKKKFEKNKDKIHKACNKELEKVKSELLQMTSLAKQFKADFANYQDRTFKNNKVIKDEAIAQVVTSLLSVLDDINAAKEAGELNGPFKAVANKLDSVLAEYGVEQIGKVGDAFDPTIHDALIVSPDSTGTEEKIVKIIQPGYRINNRVIRPARVVVK